MIALLTCNLDRVNDLEPTQPSAVASETIDAPDINDRKSKTGLGTAYWLLRTCDLWSAVSWLLAVPLGFVLGWPTILYTLSKK